MFQIASFKDHLHRFYWNLLCKTKVCWFELSLAKTKYFYWPLLCGGYLINIAYWLFSLQLKLLDIAQWLAQKDAKHKKLLNLLCIVYIWALQLKVYQQEIILCFYFYCSIPEETQVDEKPSEGPNGGGITGSETVFRIWGTRWRTDQQVKTLL